MSRAVKQPQVVDYEPYYEMLQKDTDELYEIANRCRSQGADPELEVEIPQANDLADRTQKLLNFLHSRKTAEQIRELTELHDGNRELVALDLAKIVCAETFLYAKTSKCGVCDGKGTRKKGYRTRDCHSCEGSGLDLDYTKEILTKTWEETLEDMENFADIKKTTKTRMALCIYHGICAGLAVLTEGILVAPLEGVVSCRIIDNASGSRSLAINFAGPIRSAGGTGQALSVLIGDILRRQFGLEPPEMTFEEIERYKEEVMKYGRGLQYRPSNPQIEVLCNNCPVYLDGEGVGEEVTGQRDLPRVPTNKCREGALLVLCEGMVLKAPKILKYTDALGFTEWEWLRQFAPNKEEEDDGPKTLQPINKFLADMVAGRPIFSQPMQVGGFRLRYGRSRLAGLATTAVHPATMKVVAGFFITGTQLKYERPGKGTVVTPCDTIEGPYVQFTDGSGKRIQDPADLPDGLPTDPDWPIAKIWDIGELLVPVGEFLENNHTLAPSPYVKEWHEQVLEREGASYPTNWMEALEVSQKLGCPIPPEYMAFYNEVEVADIERCAAHTQVDSKSDSIFVAKDGRDVMYRLGIDIDSEGKLQGEKGVFWGWLVSRTPNTKERPQDGLEWVNIRLPSGVEARSAVTLRIGARMGKPEGSKPREMKPAIHGLFPVGFKVGNKRLMRDAAAKKVKIEVGLREDEETGEQTWQRFLKNPDGSFRKTKFVELQQQKVGFNELWEEALKDADLLGTPEVKGVKGMTSVEKTPEAMLKGVLRYKHGVSVFRDGTLRWDMVDVTMTHFRPVEIGMSIAAAHKLGYTHDIFGDPLTDENQSCELRVQDVVLPTNCADNLVKATKFLDDLLIRQYGEKAYYNVEEPKDLIGHLGMGIAPHTSGAIVCRIIGFADIKGHYGHPFFHAAKRRNCDGDIDAFLLLLDGILNFSRAFLAGHRGGQMDAPLILTMRINPSEIDKEALNVDTSMTYPITFYEGTQSYPDAKEAVKLGVEIVETRLGSPAELSGFGFTHDTTDCGAGPKINPYTELESMRQKTMAQFALGDLLHAVDNEQQASILIDRHLIRDMRGNLRAFGQQKVRCPKCGAKYRRPPISGRCRTLLSEKSSEESVTGEHEVVYCDGNIILTVSKGSVKKYDSLMNDLVEKYGCDNYIEQLYYHVSDWVSQTFDDNDEMEQSQLQLDFL